MDVQDKYCKMEIVVNFVFRFLMLNFGYPIFEGLFTQKSSSNGSIRYMV
jgi:hypothetical protein